MLTPEEIREALRDRLLTMIAKETGVNRNTLSQIKNGHHTNLTQDTIRRLSLYLGAKDAK